MLPKSFLIEADFFERFPIVMENWPMFDFAIIDPPYPSIASGGWASFGYGMEELERMFLLAGGRSERSVVFGKFHDAFAYIDAGFEIHQAVPWVKPYSTKNPQVRYADFTEYMFFDFVGFQGRMEHWTQRVAPVVDFVDSDVHPHRKPRSLIERLIKNHTLGGDYVLDPFAGSGVVKEVCDALGRNYLGFEMYPEGKT